MVTSADQPFFAASVGAAAALLGLLFVAISIAPERTVGASAPVERQMIAESVFTALINAFFVSMAGTLPTVNLGNVALALSAFGTIQTIYVGWRLRPRKLTVGAITQRLALVIAALVIYGLQFMDALQLLRLPATVAPLGNQVNLIFAIYAFALGRSWELLGARHGTFLRRLSPYVRDDSDRPTALSAGAGVAVTTDPPDSTSKPETLTT
jgi:hypothetical protein